MRIVQVLLDDRIGGAERLAATLAQEWVQLGDVTSVVLLDPEGEPAKGPRARVLRLRTALRAEKADLVVAHSALPNLYARVAAPIGTPVVAVLHSAQDDFAERGLRAAERVLHRRGTVVAVSDEQREVYRRRFPAAHIETIPNGITPELPRRSARSVDAAGPLHVVTVSRVAEQKRPELWQRIAAEATGEHLLFEWFGPALDNKAVALVARHRADGAPGRFMGPTDDVGRVLAGADVLLHTSSREASSIGLMEAAAVGLPILCSASVESTLPKGLAWAVFDDAEGAASALRRLSVDYRLAEEHAEQWRETIRETASARRCAEAYRALGRQR